MERNLKIAVVQAKVPFTWQEGEEQIKRLIRKVVTRPIDMVGLPEDCVAPKEDVEKGYNPLDFLSSVAKINSIYLFEANFEKEGKQDIYNTGFLYDREGKLSLL